MSDDLVPSMQSFRRVMLLLLLLADHLCFSSSSPLTRFSDPRSAIVQNEQSVHTSSDSSTSAANSSGNFQRRATANAYDFRILGYTAILPFGIAAEFMQELWTDVVRLANQKLQEQSQDDQLEVTLGMIVVTFRSLYGPLDWRTVIAFAIRGTNEGRTSQLGLWRGALQNTATNAMIGVVLMVTEADVIQYLLPEE